VLLDPGEGVLDHWNYTDVVRHHGGFMASADSGNRLQRLAYSPDEAAELMGLSRELVNDLLRTGELKSIKAGRRRLIARHHLAAFLGVPEASIA